MARLKDKTAEMGRGRSSSTPAPRPGLETLVEETVALFHRFTAVAQDLHGQGELTAGKRGVLRGLDRGGPQTVPQMARARPVSRQYIQTLVNLLAAEGHVEFQDNPAHKRSRLVRLTPKGKEFLEAMYHKEAALLAKLDLPVGERDLQSAAVVLKQVRESFAGEQWKRLLKTLG